VLTASEIAEARKAGAALLKRAGIVITPREAGEMEIADFGLGDLAHTGLLLVVYVNTLRCCAKELVMYPHQTCPQHRHPSVNGSPGKEETFRCRWGRCYLYVEGEPTASPACRPPIGSESHYTVWHEVLLDAGDQYTLQPDTWHWFQSGPQGAVVSEFSTRSTDEYDVFMDPRIVRETTIAD
jgi:D-lyxose ketol-isomerase